MQWKATGSVMTKAVAPLQRCRTETHRGAGPVPGSLRREELLSRYQTRTGRDIPDIVFYYCFALFKSCGVVQQIYYRYKQGLTHDERFAGFGFGVQLLARSAVEAAGRGAF